MFLVKQQQQPNCYIYNPLRKQCINQQPKGTRSRTAKTYRSWNSSLLQQTKSSNWESLLTRQLG